MKGNKEAHRVFLARSARYSLVNFLGENIDAYLSHVIALFISTHVNGYRVY